MNNRLSKWIEFGRDHDRFNTGRKVRRWLNEARGRCPVIDRVNFPNDRRAYPGIARRG
jgi:hypothetical protein